MNILYCGDKNIGQGLMLSVLSLLKHTDEPLHIYILTMGYTDGSHCVQPLSQNVTDAVERRIKQKNIKSAVTLLDVSEQFSRQPPKANLDTRFTPCCMLRLYADLLPQLPDRLLYLDTDVLCRKNFRDFYNQNIERYELAGVLDHYGKWFFRNHLFRMDYLNSGVLLLNMEQLRKTGLLAKCRWRCGKRKMFMPDQSALNKLCQSKKLLPCRYNEQRRLRSDTVFQHFTTGFRFFPWIHTVTVKPWQIEKMHEVLKLHEYDDLLEEFLRWKEELTCVM